MLNNSLNKQWKEDFFRIFATEQNNLEELEKADKLKFEHFPPVIGNFYPELIDEKTIKTICSGKLKLSKAKLEENYNAEILKIDYLKTIKEQLNTLMKQQIEQLHNEDPTFLSPEEKEIIEKAEFPFIKLMTLVYSKDTNEMTSDEQREWKEQMNNFINQQIVFGVINTHYTMKLYQDNNYVRIFQTPYNKNGLWEEYADEKKGFCIAYDFKQISESTARQLNKLFPVLYFDKKITSDDLDFEVNNIHCTSLTKSKEDVHDYDNEWMYIFNHHFTETEYAMLDNLLEPVYTQTTNNNIIQNIIKTNYLVPSGDDLEYDYNKIIDDLLNVLESEEFKNEIETQLEQVYDITDDMIEVDFLKPEAVYLGVNFPEDKMREYKQIVEEENIRIFKIKENDEGKLYKSLI